MSLQKKYYYTFKSLDGKVNLVEIWQNTATTLTAEEVIPGSMPFSVELPDLDNKFQPVWGKGCEINLISDTDMKFFAGLYHVDKKEFIVKHYIDTVINFIGYLNSEMSRESYSYTTNYPIQVIGNDGFALLERIQFVQTTGDIYTGVKSLFEILTIIIDRIELPFEAINIALSTTSAVITIGADDTILHHQYIDCANFINEDGEAETMRKVLDSILQPFAAVIVQEAGAVWITDIHTKAGAADITFKSFVLSTTWDYDTDIIISQALSISTVGYSGTESDIERSGGKNKQVVSYSPYPIKEILPETLTDLSEFSGTVPATFSTKGAYKYKELTGHNALNVHSPAVLEQSYRFTGVTVDPEIESEASICADWSAGTAGTKVLELSITPLANLTKGLTISEVSAIRKSFRGIAIKISGQIQFWRYWGSGKDGGVRNCTIKAILRVGDKSATSSGPRPGWEDYPGSPQKYISILTEKDDLSNIAGEWIDIRGISAKSLYCTNDIDLSGQCYLDIYSEINYTDTNGTVWTNTNIHNASVRLRNLSVTIVDASTIEEVGDTDVEYIGYLDTKQKDEADKVELICGTDITFADRGKLMYLDTVYKAIKTWERDGQTFEIEKLLLNSLSSNYREGYITLNSIKLNNSFNTLNVFSDTFTGTSVLSPKSMTINYRDNLIECNLHEIFQDELTIESL
jgi:hypothetical protein